jgi:hypothetical protein
MRACSPTKNVPPLELRRWPVFNVKSLTKLLSLLYSVAPPTPPSEPTKCQLS